MTKSNRNARTDGQSENTKRRLAHLQPQVALRPIRAVLAWIVHTWLQPPDREARWEQR